MEIQDLKSIWHKVMDIQGTKYQIDEHDVIRLVHKKSNALLSQIKRELHYKRWFLGGC